MTVAEAPLRVRVDPTNPGQFFACCGLLELADRAWGGAEGWFEGNTHSFYLQSMNTAQCSIAEMIDRVQRIGLRGALSAELKRERDALETKRRELKKEKQVLSQAGEKRRKELGTLLRAGSIAIAEPFGLRLDWWGDESDDVPKTWAGSQEVLRIALAALVSCREAFATESPFEYYCVMRSHAGGSPAEDPGETLDAEGNDDNHEVADGDKVEPFYFDAVRGAHAHPLDVGFSPNKHKHLTLTAAPAIEFLCLVGLQRHRPKPTNEARVFEYYTWASPVTTCIAPAAVSGLLPHVGSRIFRFENAFRTDQRKHKGFTQAASFARREQ